MLLNSLTNDELIRCLEESDSELCKEAAKRLAGDTTNASNSDNIKMALEEVQDARRGLEVCIHQIEDTEETLKQLVKEIEK